MASRSYTFIIVPNASSRLRKFRIPGVVVNILAVAGVISLFVTGGMLVTYLKMASQTADYNQIVSENTQLRVLTRNLEVSTRQLGSKLVDLQILSDKLTNLIESEGWSKKFGRVASSLTGGGVGGSKEDYSTSRLMNRLAVKDDVDHMKTHVQELENQMRLLEQVAHYRASILRATPSVWPVRGNITSHYGSRNDPFNGDRENHMGLDISALYGSTIRATADGIVMFAQRQAAYGNLIVLNHSNGLTTRFGHLSRFAVHVGQRVRRGDIIGYVGMTGRATSPHLHYEVRLNDRPVNPRTYLPRG